MRLVTYRGEAGERAGVDTDDGVFDAAALLGDQSASVRGLIAQDRVGELRERLESGIGAIDPIPAPELLPPITDPEKIVCIGLNYRSHAAEAGIDPPADPTFFAKFRNALASPGATVKLPVASEKVDYEAEIAWVVGRRCKEIASGDALDAIAGYTLLNDLSARDLQFATPQWMPGKVFDGSQADSPLPAPLLDQLLDPPVDVRGVLLQPLHLEVAEADQLQAGLGGDGRAPHRVVEHSRLAEDVTRSEIGDLLAVAGHLRLAVLDREELPRVTPLLDHDLSLWNLLRLGENSDPPELLVRGIREKRDPLQLAYVQGLSSRPFGGDLADRLLPATYSKPPLVECDADHTNEGAIRWG